MLFGCKERLTEEFQFFGNYDLGNGEYKLLVYGMEGEWIEDYQDFYIDDPVTLLNMKEQWVFDYKMDPMPCGYGYIIQLVADNKILNKKSININCEYMSGWIYFPKEYLANHISSFKKMSEKDKSQFSERYK